MNTQWPKWIWATISILILLVIGFVDARTDFELNLFVFYFLPIALGAWFLGEVAAVTFAVLATVAWYGADVISGHVYTSNFFTVWDTVIHLLSFFIVGKATFKIQSTLDLANKTSERLKQALFDVEVLETFLPTCKWQKGTVRQETEHIELSCDVPIARITAPDNYIYTVEFLLDENNPDHVPLIKWAQSQLDHYLVEMKVLNPWEHAKSRCSEESNASSSLKWAYHPEEKRI